jgi:hypothetical protein
MANGHNILIWHFQYFPIAFGHLWHLAMVHWLLTSYEIILQKDKTYVLWTIKRNMTVCSYSFYTCIIDQINKKIKRISKNGPESTLRAISFRFFLLLNFTLWSWLDVHLEYENLPWSAPAIYWIFAVWHLAFAISFWMKRRPFEWYCTLCICFVRCQ